MDASSFQFTMSLPGDSRLVGAVRDLTNHAAGYAGLSKDVAETLTGDVVAATEAAIASTRSQDSPIQFDFARDGGVLRVTISSERVDGSMSSHVVQAS